MSNIRGVRFYLKYPLKVIFSELIRIPANIYMLTKLHQILNKPSDPLPVVLFRVVFGIIMTIEMISYWNIPFIDELILKPKIHFRFQLLDIVPVGSVVLLKVTLLVATISSVLIAAGRFYKVASILLFVTYTYLFLLDETYYNNHIYMIVNVCLLMIFIGANTGVKTRKEGKAIVTQSTVPFWHILILRFLLFVVYFYGGIAKLNADWMSGATTTEWLRSFGGVLATKEAALFFAIAGMLFDLIIGFLLFMPKTRYAGIFLVFMFNTSNAIMFKDISIFPYLMIGAMVLFLDPEWVRKKADWAIRFADWLSDKKKMVASDSPVPVWLYVFFAFHILFPFRLFLFNGNADWTGKAQYFSWHMKSHHRDIKNLTFYLSHDNHPEKIRVPVEEYLVYEQFYVMGHKPEMLVEFARFLKKDLEKKGVVHPKITAVSSISFNGKPPQPMVDSTLDLTTVVVKPFASYDWVLPLAN